MNSEILSGVRVSLFSRSMERRNYKQRFEHEEQRIVIGEGSSPEKPGTRRDTVREGQIWRKM